MLGLICLAIQVDLRFRGFLQVCDNFCNSHNNFLVSIRKNFHNNFLVPIRKCEMIICKKIILLDKKPQDQNRHSKHSLKKNRAVPTLLQSPPRSLHQSIRRDFQAMVLNDSWICLNISWSRFHSGVGALTKCAYSLFLAHVTDIKLWAPTPSISYT